MRIVEVEIREEIRAIGGWLGPDLTYTVEVDVQFDRPVSRADLPSRIGISGLPSRIEAAAVLPGPLRIGAPPLLAFRSDGPSTWWHLHLVAESTEDLG